MDSFVGGGKGGPPAIRIGIVWREIIALENQSACHRLLKVVHCSSTIPGGFGGILSIRRAEKNRKAKKNSGLGLYYLVGLSVIHGSVFRLCLIFITVTQFCYPIWDFWLFGSGLFSSPFQIFYLSFVLLGILVCVDLGRAMALRVSVGWPTYIGYGFVLAWIVSGTVFLTSLHGMMVPGGVSERVHLTVSRFVFYEVGSYYMDDEIPNGPLGTCSELGLEQYLYWLEWKDIERQERDRKKSFFEERDWSVYKPVDPPGKKTVIDE